MTRTWRPPKSDEVRQSEKRKQELQKQLAFIAEYLDEADFHEAVKDLKPTPEQLVEWTMLFRAYQQQTRGL